MVVMDSFALPVEGTETRVNAQAQAYEYMTTFTDNCEKVERKDKVTLVRDRTDSSPTFVPRHAHRDTKLSMEDGLSSYLVSATFFVETRWYHFVAVSVRYL